MWPELIVCDNGSWPCFSAAIRIHSKIRLHPQNPICVSDYYNQRMSICPYYPSTRPTSSLTYSREQSGPKHKSASTPFLDMIIQFCCHISGFWLKCCLCSSATQFSVFHRPSSLICRHGDWSWSASVLHLGLIVTPKNKRLHARRWNHCVSRSLCYNILMLHYFSTVILWHKAPQKPAQEWVK